VLTRREWSVRELLDGLYTLVAVLAFVFVRRHGTPEDSFDLVNRNAPASPVPQAINRRVATMSHPGCTVVNEREGDG
jgi:hypothetical protein